MGLATNDTMAPMVSTSVRLLSLVLGAMASTCSGSRNWMGAKKAVQMPRFARPSTIIMDVVTRLVGSPNGSTSSAASPYPAPMTIPTCRSSPRGALLGSQAVDVLASVAKVAPAWWCDC